MSAVARLADITTITLEPTKWFFGAIALVTFLVLVVVVTRFNIDR